MARSSIMPGFRPAQHKILTPAPVANVLRHAAEYCGGDPFTSCARGKMARWAVMLALRNQGLSFPRIGRIVNRDHTTVIYGVNQARLLRSRDADFIALLERMGALGRPTAAPATFPYPGHRTMAEVLADEGACG